MNGQKDSTRKHDRVLEIYSRLLSGEVIRKQELADEYGVTPRSIQRDIDSIRDFYSNRAGKNGDLTEIKYDRNAKGFRIVSGKTITLSNAELFTISKILLESRSLCKDEIQNIIKDLMAACIPLSEQKKMTDLIRNELFHYIEPRHGKALVDKIWELGSAVYSHHKIQISYCKANGETTHALVKPVGIMESEYYFYLIAYIGDNDKDHPGYPTIYRIDRIESYKISDEIFHVPYKNRFEEGEFRKRIPFMYGGKLQKVNFIYKGNDINVILDRLPTAQAFPKEDGSYLITAEVFGEIGLKLWINGQNDITFVK